MRKLKTVIGKRFSAIKEDAPANVKITEAVLVTEVCLFMMKIFWWFKPNSY